MQCNLCYNIVPMGMFKGRRKTWKPWRGWRSRFWSFGRETNKKQLSTPWTLASTERGKWRSKQSLLLLIKVRGCAFRSVSQAGLLTELQCLTVSVSDSLRTSSRQATTGNNRQGRMCVLMQGRGWGSTIPPYAFILIYLNHFLLLGKQTLLLLSNS